MNFEAVIKNLNQTIEEKQPPTINASWIVKNCPKSYGYIQRNVRTDNGHIDWDTVTHALERSFSKKWVRYRKKNIRRYERRSEVDVILNRYKDKLYTFLGYAEEGDKSIHDKMTIQLVRIAQRGNICAEEELIQWVTYITDDWIDRYPQVYKWKCYSDEVPDKIRGCIRCYRYTGSFLGYLFRTLEYSARGKPPLVSLDDKILDGTKSRHEYVQAEEP
jgi:hypothetical protein